MSQEPENKDFIAFLKRGLDEGTHQLDAGIQSRLTRARYNALEQKASKGAGLLDWIWNPATAVATAAGLILALSLTLNLPSVSQKGSNLEDLDLLTATDQLELYEDLEFYAWLAEEESAEIYEKG